jgi:hypothetical protein
MERSIMKATDKSTPRTGDEAEEWIRTIYWGATPDQRVVLRQVLEQLFAGKEFDEVSIARFRRRFGRRLPELQASLDALKYRQAVERARK